VNRRLLNEHPFKIECLHLKQFWERANPQKHSYCLPDIHLPLVIISMSLSRTGSMKTKIAAIIMTIINMIFKQPPLTGFTGPKSVDMGILLS